MNGYAIGGTRNNERQRETKRGGGANEGKAFGWGTREQGNKGGQTAKTLVVASNQ